MKDLIYQSLLIIVIIFICPSNIPAKMLVDVYYGKHYYFTEHYKLTDKCDIEIKGVEICYELNSKFQLMISGQIHSINTGYLEIDRVWDERERDSQFTEIPEIEYSHSGYLFSPAIRYSFCSKASSIQPYIMGGFSMFFWYLDFQQLPGHFYLQNSNENLSPLLGLGTDIIFSKGIFFTFKMKCHLFSSETIQEDRELGKIVFPYYYWKKPNNYGGIEVYAGLGYWIDF